MSVAGSDQWRDRETGRAYDYDERKARGRPGGCDVACELCETIDYATPRRRHCRFCGGWVHVVEPPG